MAPNDKDDAFCLKPEGLRPLNGFEDSVIAGPRLVVPVQSWDRRRVRPEQRSVSNTEKGLYQSGAEDGG